MIRSIPFHHGRTLKHYERFDIRVTRIQFDPDQEIERHTHERACFGIVLAGVVSETFANRSLSFKRGTLLFRPAGIAHCDRIGPTGADCVAIELAEGFSTLREVGISLSEPTRTETEAAVQFGVRLLQQMQIGDDLAGMAIEGIVLELLADHGRRTEASNTPPRWLFHAREIIDDSLERRLTLSEISLSAGVHPVHLAQMFRRYFGCTVGTYIRRQRVEAASTALRLSDEPIAEIALDCGFSSQAHLTSVFRAVMGITPAAYRRQCVPLIACNRIKS